MPAPWRQTGGGGGSEFGKPKWLAALKDGYKTAEEPPRFTLWQLALADSVVRFPACPHCPACLFVSNAPMCCKAERMVRPTNPKAVGAAGITGGAGGGRVGGDTETAVRRWMEKLSEKLKGVNPAPVVIVAESQDAPATRIELIIDGHTPAATLAS